MGKYSAISAIIDEYTENFLEVKGLNERQIKNLLVDFADEILSAASKNG